MNATPLTLSPSVTLDSSVAHEIQRITAGLSDAETCNTDLAAGPWNFDGRPGYGPGSSMGDVIPAGSPRQGELPVAYREASEAELHDRIVAAKRTLGDRVVILGHFYQREEVVRHADYVGDSFQLANAAKAHPEAEAIVFCGVHFMAETADLLSRPEQAVILPNLAAGCSMADMANIDQVEECWEQLEDVYGPMDAVDVDGLVPVIPVTYMNSSAAIKGFVGRHGGIVCTSSNARTVLEWAFARGRRVLFFPDQHLGRNTAKAMGVPLEQMPMWNPNRPLGGNDASALDDARVILWHGFCSVHRRFTVDQIEKARAEHPGVRVIVHPECPMPVVDAADEAGSTDYIRKAIEAATEPTTFAIGTEVNLVQRLAAEHPQHTIFCLDPVVCPCSTMYRIHPGYLAWVLEELVGGPATAGKATLPEPVEGSTGTVEAGLVASTGSATVGGSATVTRAGRIVNRITVAADVAEPARIALERMLAAKPAPQVTA